MPPTIHGYHTSGSPGLLPTSYPSTGCFNRPEPRRLKCKAQRGHPPILPTVTTHIHSLSVAITIVIVLRRCSVVLTLSRWEVITCSRRRMVLVVGKYERPVEATSMGKSCSSLEIVEAIGRKPAGSS
ncbi:hypothetical protein HOY82DRAFT_572866 [Tuber indicum]|nr:hypothetical protein HOY82DRAFT_572866 [Tuber indicum]